MNNVEIIKPYKIEKGQAYKFYTGTVYKTNEGYDIKVIEYIDYFNIVIEFLYNGFRTIVRLDDIKNGSIKNPFHPNKYGGYIGNGIYNKFNYLKSYSTWYKLLERLNIEYQNNNSRNNSYSNCSICDEWYNYQNFAEWYNQYIDSLNKDLYNDYQIDKDILQWNQEYKIYSPSTCCLIPSYLNIVLSGKHSTRLHPELPLGIELKPSGKSFKYAAIYRGNKNINLPTFLGMFDTIDEAFEVYRRAKENHIRVLADYYYSINAIHKDIYDALYNINIIKD